MLVLTRRPGESIIIGDKLVQIKILEADGINIRIGIDAPEGLSVHREEIYYCIVNDTLRPPKAGESLRRKGKKKPEKPRQTSSRGIKEPPLKELEDNHFNK